MEVSKKCDATRAGLQEPRGGNWLTSERQGMIPFETRGFPGYFNTVGTKL